MPHNIREGHNGTGQQRTMMNQRIIGNKLRIYQSNFNYVDMSTNFRLFLPTFSNATTGFWHQNIEYKTQVSDKHEKLLKALMFGVLSSESYGMDGKFV